MSNQEEFRTRDLRLAALALALDGKLLHADPDSAGHLSFTFEGVPPDLPLRVARCEVSVDAAAFIDGMERVQVLVHQHRRTQR